MTYPAKLKFKLLETCHDDYLSSINSLRRIDLLTAGGHRLEKNLEEFLPRRPGETQELYETRLSKYCYTNLLGSAISQQVSKLSNSSLVVSGLVSDENFWNEFREDTSLNGRSEKELISHVFREVLKFGKVFLHVDKPPSAVRPANRLQEQVLGLRPYVVAYSPFQVTDWYEDSRLRWIKVRQQFKIQPNPAQEPQTVVTWKFIDERSVATYSAVVELSKSGKIEKVNGEPVNDETEVSLTSEIAHGLNTLPVIKLELPDNLWVGNQAYPKALEHLKTEHSRHDMLTLAYFQRTYKRTVMPDGDLTESYTEIEPLKTGLQHVLELEKFEWNEPQGTIVEHINKTLESIKAEVRDLVSLGGGSVTTEAIRQSGVSKQMDFVKQEAILREYGALLCQCYQQVLQLVARSAGLANPELISVTGLSNFENNTLESLIEEVSNLTGINFSVLRANLPPTAYKLTYSQIVNLLVGNLSAEQQQAINDEIDQMLQSDENIIIEATGTAL
ncbi:hypothetical protein CLI64_11095 [Nostoc sp. CENA543]|uniref:hypothetical protein n=1 Tax=Nostoc sp. CENA543 TaxID=1869241 RepID=UPI000CA31415|nr:hypothetical protein [Nostoc sp. CENA543]AUT00900.1 hypothetical protein CLI64_11095 [Nostoc sp. CENA543]